MIRNICLPASPHAWSARFFFGALLFYFVCILVQALPAGLSTPLDLHCLNNSKAVLPQFCKSTKQLTASATAKDYIEYFGPSDPASYVQGALLLSGDVLPGVQARVDVSGGLGKRLSNFYYGYAMWPPGMFVLNALMLAPSLDAPLALYQTLVAGTLWAIAFGLMASQLATRLSRPLALLLPGLIMLFPLFHNTLFQNMVMFSEPYAIALAMIGMTLLFSYWTRKQAGKQLFLAGACLAAASFFRAQLYPVAIGIALLLIGAVLFRAYRNGLNLRVELRRSNVWAFALAVIVPLGAYTFFHQGQFVNYGPLAQTPFTTVAYPDAGMRNFAALGGIRAACEADSANCARVNAAIMAKTIRDEDIKREVMMTFLRHPIEFSAYKLPIAWKYWFADGPWQPVTLAYTLDNAIFLGLLVAGLGMLLAIRADSMRTDLIVVSLAFCALIFLPPFLLFHFETRYFYPIKAFAAFLPLWGLLHVLPGSMKTAS